MNMHFFFFFCSLHYHLLISDLSSFLQFVANKQFIDPNLNLVNCEDLNKIL